MRYVKKQRIFFLCVIGVLVVAVITLSLALGFKNSAYNDAKQTISDYKSQLKEEKDKNAQLQSEIEALSSQKAEIPGNQVSQPSDNPASVPVGTQPPAPTEKICYLTFDDGPSDNTLQIINILNSYNAKATFFVVGTARLDYLDEIHNSGHTVGLHTNSHVYSQIYSSDEAYLADLNAISAAVEQRIGVKSMCVRFPGGSSNLTSLNVGKCKGIMTRLTNTLPSMGYAYFDWNVDSGDAAGKNVDPAKICANVLVQAQNKTSICVLMHDSSAKSTTVQALPGIIEGLSAMGYRFEALTVQSHGYHHGVNN